MSLGTLRRQLKLTVHDVSKQAPTDISYTFSGYAPLSVRLAQLLARPGWRSVQEGLTLLPGPTVMEEQPARHRPARSECRRHAPYAGGVPGRRHVRRGGCAELKIYKKSVSSQRST